MTRQILLISGSLRAVSANTAALRTAQALAPSGVVVALYERLAGLPHFNPDNDTNPLHPEVADLRAAIHSASALLFSTPEYAGALPGSLKNLLDWTSGDDQPGSIYDKPGAWVNTSPRGARGAYDELRTVLQYAHAFVVEEACIQIPIGTAMIGSDGLARDPAVRDGLAQALNALVRPAGGPVA
jgi:NAD(P)H-dependent FMN reductase